MSNIKMMNIINEALSCASDGKVRRYALNKLEVQKNLSGFFETLTRIAKAETNDDRIVIERDGVNYTYRVDEYNIPGNCKLSAVLNFGRVYANTEAQASYLPIGKRSADYDHYSYLEDDFEVSTEISNNVLLSPEEMNAKYGWIQQTSKWNLNLSKVRKVDYLLPAVSCGWSTCRSLGLEGQTLMDAGLSEKKKHSVFQAVGFVFDDGFDAGLFGWKVRMPFTFETLVQDLALSEDDEAAGKLS